VRPVDNQNHGGGVYIVYTRMYGFEYAVKLYYHSGLVVSTNHATGTATRQMIVLLRAASATITV
jgi:hypothetical protein